LMRAIARSTGSLKVPAVAATPMIAVGLSCSIACRKSATGACWCAYGCL